LDDENEIDRDEVDRLFIPDAPATTPSVVEYICKLLKDIRIFLGRSASRVIKSIQSWFSIDGDQKPEVDSMRQVCINIETKLGHSRIGRKIVRFLRSGRGGRLYDHAYDTREQQ
jgi:hypothetical protein